MSGAKFVGFVRLVQTSKGTCSFLYKTRVQNVRLVHARFVNDPIWQERT